MDYDNYEVQEELEAKLLRHQDKIDSEVEQAIDNERGL